MICTHVLNRGGDVVDSPADRHRLHVIGRDRLRADRGIDCGSRSLSRLAKKDEILRKCWISK